MKRSEAGSPRCAASRKSARACGRSRSPARAFIRIPALKYIATGLLREINGAAVESTSEYCLPRNATNVRRRSRVVCSVSLILAAAEGGCSGRTGAGFAGTGAEKACCAAAGAGPLFTWSLGGAAAGATAAGCVAEVPLLAALSGSLLVELATVAVAGGPGRWST